MTTATLIPAHPRARSGQRWTKDDTRPVSLGMPARSAPTLARRRKTRQLMVGHVGIGSDYLVAVPSTTATTTGDTNARPQQIAELTAKGCYIAWVACPRQEDADAPPTITEHGKIPVIADVDFQPRYIFVAIHGSNAAVRISLGNIEEFDTRVKEVTKAASDAGIPIRSGVNAGSSGKRFMEKYGKTTPEALVESALSAASLFDEHGFGNIKLSVKHNDAVIVVTACELFAAQCDCPLHLGVREAGPAVQGTIRSAVAFGALLKRGIGDTIRVSLSAPSIEEIKVGHQIPKSRNLRPRSLEIVPYPSCRRARVEVYTLANEVTAGLEGMEVSLRVAVSAALSTGSVKRGSPTWASRPAMARARSSSAVKSSKPVPDSQIVETLIEQAMQLAASEKDSGSGLNFPVPHHRKDQAPCAKRS